MKTCLFAGVFAAAALTASAAMVALPPPPPCDYADTEASTNLAFSLRTEGREFFEVAISLAANASNNLEVAFGRDTDSDGSLSIEEQSLTIGWDSGCWFLRDETTGERISAPRENGLRRLDCRIMLDRTLRPCGLLGFDSGVVFSCGRGSTPASLFDTEWNLVRVTARGVRDFGEQLSVGFVPAGFCVRLR